MRFAKWVFTLAGISGLVTVPPDYFLEGVLARRYGALGEPLWYYGFLGCVVIFQVLYLVIGRDPVRYRPMMPVALAAKLAFAATAFSLWFASRAPLEQALFTTPDLIWSVLFLIAWLRTPRSHSQF